MKKMPIEKEKVSTYYTAYLSLNFLVILYTVSLLMTILLIPQLKVLLLMKTILRSVQRQFPAPV